MIRSLLVLVLALLFAVPSFAGQPGEHRRATAGRGLNIRPATAVRDGCEARDDGPAHPGTPEEGGGGYAPGVRGTGVPRPRLGGPCPPAPPPIAIGPSLLGLGGPVAAPLDTAATTEEPAGRFSGEAASR